MSETIRMTQFSFQSRSNFKWNSIYRTTHFIYTMHYVSEWNTIFNMNRWSRFFNLVPGL